MLIDKAEKQYAADKSKKIAEKDKAIYFILEAHEGDVESGGVSESGLASVGDTVGGDAYHATSAGDSGVAAS